MPNAESKMFSNGEFTNFNSTLGEVVSSKLPYCNSISGSDTPIFAKKFGGTGSDFNSVKE